MPEMLTRMLPIGNKRMGVRLDTSTWQTVDWLAQQAGQSWQAWCNDVLKAVDPNAKNLTAEIRQAAMDGLLTRTIFADRAGQLTGVGSVGMALSGLCDDKEFADDMHESVIDYTGEFGGFVLRSGIDPNGNVAFWIENGLRSGPHTIVRTPFTPEQWHAALDEMGETT